MLLSSWALLTMEEKIISVEEKIIWKGLKKKKSVFSERMTVKNSTLLLVYKQIFPVFGFKRRCRDVEADISSANSPLP